MAGPCAPGRVYAGAALTRQQPARRYANAAEAERDFRARLLDLAVDRLEDALNARDRAAVVQQLRAVGRALALAAAAGVDARHLDEAKACSAVAERELGAGPEVER